MSYNYIYIYELINMSETAEYQNKYSLEEFQRRFIECGPGYIYLNSGHARDAIGDLVNDGIRRDVGLADGYPEMFEVNIDATEMCDYMVVPIDYLVSHEIFSLAMGSSTVIKDYIVPEFNGINQTLNFMNIIKERGRSIQSDENKLILKSAIRNADAALKMVECLKHNGLNPDRYSKLRECALETIRRASDLIAPVDIESEYDRITESYSRELHILNRPSI